MTMPDPKQGAPQSNNGCLILVVGPSGVGKDTLLRKARVLLKDETKVMFPQRLITRPCEPQYEEHGSLSEAEFEAICVTDNAPLHWRAHGHGYVVPASVLQAVLNGQCCVVNGSRGVLGAAKSEFPKAYCIAIELDRDGLKARIAARGRENENEAKERLMRKQPDLTQVTGVHRIINNQTAEEGAAALADLIRACALGELDAL